MEAEVAEISRHFLTEVARLEPFLLNYGLFAIMLAVAVEGFGIPAPGQTLLMAGSVLAAHGHFNITLVLLSAWCAVIAGSLIGYVIGRTGGRKLLLRLPVNAARLARMEQLCVNYGGRFVVVSRFLDGFRQFGNILVGVLEMPAPRFLIMTAAGAALWVGIWGLGAFYLDKNFDSIIQAIKSLSPLTWIAAGCLLLAVVTYLLRGKTRNRN